MKKRRHFLAIGAAILLLSGCGPSEEPGAAGDSPTVAVSLYPLEFLATEIGGDHISLTNIVPPGAEPHDIELTMQDAYLLDSADVAVILGGFQPAVDAAAKEAGAVTDLSSHIDLAERDGNLDPHFWLDPTLMITAADVLVSLLTEADPQHADAYASGHAALVHELRELDEAYTSAFADCAHSSFVTGHAAFGYLADAYGLTEISIAGIDPDTEPSPAALAATKKQVADLGLPMIFAEPGETKIAQVLAGELGIDWGVLNPVEVAGPTDTYVSVMEENLAALREGLACR